MLHVGRGAERPRLCTLHRQGAQRACGGAPRCAPRPARARCVFKGRGASHAARPAAGPALLRAPGYMLPIAPHHPLDLGAGDDRGADALVANRHLADGHALLRRDLARSLQRHDADLAGAGQAGGGGAWGETGGWVCMGVAGGGWTEGAGGGEGKVGEHLDAAGGADALGRGAGWVEAHISSGTAKDSPQRCMLAAAAASAASGEPRTLRAIASAVSGWSPVTIATRMPALRGGGARRTTA